MAGSTTDARPRAGTLTGVDPERRRILRLAALGAFSVAGGGVLASRLLDGESTDDTVAPPTNSSVPRTSTAPASRETGASESSTTTEAAPTEPAATMLCREAWGARPVTRAMRSHVIEGVMVHHTAVVLSDNREAPARLRSHQEFHQSRGFADIAYHVVIDSHGHAYQGRDPATPGETFTEYDPEGWYLVTCEGNFDAQPLPEAQRSSLEHVLAWASIRFGVDPSSVRAHSGVSPTACPGDAVEAVFADGSLIDGVRRRIVGGIDLPLVCGEEATARIAAIEAGTA